MSPPGLKRLLTQHAVVVCCGTGGVGKTSVAAALGIAAAREGRRSIVVTVDPARRLASALGLADTGNEIHTVSDDASGIDLDIVMLDARAMFDSVIETEAQTPEQAHAILSNPMYRSIAGALGGTQEYMASELLHQLTSAGTYDVVIVDTPPSRHALDLLDAPSRIVRLLDNRLVRMLMMPARTTLRAAGGAIDAALRNIGRVVGGGVLADAVALLRLFDGMEQGFRDRSDAVDTILRSPTTAYVLVTSARSEPVAETTRFSQQLRERSRVTSAVVVNRTPPLLPNEQALISEAEHLRDAESLSDSGLQAVEIALETLREAAAARRTLGVLRGETPNVPWWSIDRRPEDVHDFAGLLWMSQQMRPVAWHS